MRSASVMRASMAASPPNKYGTGECHGEDGSAAAAGGGDVGVGLDDALFAGGLIARIGASALCCAISWQFLAGRGERWLGVGGMAKWRVRLMRGIYL